jgi:hypothetical protein
MSRSRNDQGSFQARVALSRQRSTTSSRPPETCALLIKKNPVRVVKIRSNFSRPSLVVVSFGVGQLYRSSRHRVPVNSRGLEAFFCAHAGHRRTTRQQLLRLLRCQVASCKLLILRRHKRRAAGVMKGHVMEMWRHLAVRSPSCYSSSCIEHCVHYVHY